MGEETTKNPWVIGAVLLVVGLGLGYWIGSGSYQKGYDKAVADAKAAQEESAQKAGEEAAKAANPFQAVNPLEGVTANPFEKAQKALNPFAN